MTPINSLATTRLDRRHRGAQLAIASAVALIFALTLALPAVAQTPPSPPPTSTRVADAGHQPSGNLLVLEVRLDSYLLSDSLSAYQDGRHVLLPLGELARLLSLAISVNADAGSATGFVIRQNNGFDLNLAQGLVSLAGKEQNLDRQLAVSIGDDIYLDSALLSRLLPIDFDVGLSAMVLQVKPRETLPMQARLERERLGARAGKVGSGQPDPGFPIQASPYKMADLPFIDQTLGLDARAGPGERRLAATYTAYLTGDLLAMEAAAYVSATSATPKPDVRLVFGRQDPDAGLLGPLHARTLQIGNIQIPGVANVMRGGPKGVGVTVSNRPLDRPTSFDRHNLRGDLPPGWDVTLYYNDALIGFQAARADGLYAFDDLPLSFGANEFRLLFNGPLGQTRVERQSFLLDQSITKPGEVYYSVAQHQADDGGGQRSVATVDIGLTPAIAAGVGLVRMPRAGSGDSRSYLQLGLRGYWQSFIATSQWVREQNGATLAEFGLKTRLGGFAIDLLETALQGGFESDDFSASDDPLRRRDHLRVVGALALPSLPVLPLAIDLKHEVRASGQTSDDASGRISAMLGGTAITNGLHWVRSGGIGSADGSLQLSRRVADIGLSSQIGYTLSPLARVGMLAISADRNLNNGYRINLGLMHMFTSPMTLVSAGLSKNFGGFGLSLSGSYASSHVLTLGLQLFAAIGRDPRSGEWMAEAQPLASTGAASVRAFVDRNQNGVRDAGEEFVANAGFLINGGGRHAARTDANGVAFLSRLAPGQYADIALDPATLEDPQWKPVLAGVRLLPRPGRIDQIEFPVIVTGEVDGTVYLTEGTRRRGIGDATVELIGANGAVVATSKSASDGFYILHQVPPGRFTVRIAPDQVAKLGLVGSLTRPLEMPDDGDFVSGIDFELRLLPK
jgi:hypothetical protein